jgi:hypothetical protein
MSGNLEVDDKVIRINSLIYKIVMFYSVLSLVLLIYDLVETHFFLILLIQAQKHISLNF